MGRVNKLNLVIGILAITALIAIFIFSNQESQLQLAEFNYVISPNGIETSRSKSITFDGILEDVTHITIGRVLEEKEFQPGMSLFLVAVEEQLSGKIDESIIYVCRDINAFKPGERYLIFSYLSSLTEEPHDMYVSKQEFTIKISESERLLRLQDPERLNPKVKEYIEPFINDKYNNLKEIKKYIIKRRNEQLIPQKVKAMEKADNLQQLIDISDVIIEVYVLEANDAYSPYIKFVTYQQEETFKDNYNSNLEARNGSIMTNSLLPSYIEVNKRYIIFFTSMYSENYLSPTTRQGSIISEDDEEYALVLEQLKKLKRDI